MDDERIKALMADPWRLITEDMLAEWERDEGHMTPYHMMGVAFRMIMQAALDEDV